EADASVEHDRVVDDRAGEEANRPGSRGREAEAVDVSPREHGRGRERVREAEGLEARHPRAEPGDEPARDRVRSGEGDLLPDDRAHARLERVPGARGTETGARVEERPDRRVRRELDRRLREVEVEAPDPSGALDDVDELVPVRQVRAQQEMVVSAGTEL